MTDETERMLRAERAQAARAEFIDPLFEELRGDYLTALVAAASCPMTNDKRAEMEKLGLAIKMIERVHARIAAVIADGDVANAEARRTSNLAALSPEKRRWALF